MVYLSLLACTLCHGVHLLACVSWCALVGLCVMVCICWLVCHGVHLLACVSWCALVGLSGVETATEKWGGGGAEIFPLASLPINSVNFSTGVVQCRVAHN